MRTLLAKNASQGATAVYHAATHRVLWRVCGLNLVETVDAGASWVSEAIVAPVLREADGCARKCSEAGTCAAH